MDREGLTTYNVHLVDLGYLRPITDPSACTMGMLAYIPFSDMLGSKKSKCSEKFDVFSTGAIFVDMPFHLGRPANKPSLQCLREVFYGEPGKPLTNLRRLSAHALDEEGDALKKDLWPDMWPDMWPDGKVPHLDPVSAYRPTAGTLLEMLKNKFCQRRSTSEFCSGSEASQ